MNPLKVLPPEKKIKASIQLGGSKSISNRILLLHEVLARPFSIFNLSDSEDTRLLSEALQLVNKQSSGVINVNHAGTDLRFLTAFLSVRQGSAFTLSGSARLKERPIVELVQALQQLGADIEFTERTGYPPLRIKGKTLKGGTIHLRADISSQFVSSLLLIAPLLPLGLDICLEGEPVSEPYIRMSLELLKNFGQKSEVQTGRIRVLPSSPLPEEISDFTVESDWSSASYWYSVCALSVGAEITLSQLYSNSLQADSCLPQLFSKLGVKSEWDGNQLNLKQVPLKAQWFEYDFTSCPDLAPTLACTCLGLGIKARLYGLKTLQLKESRRIDALTSELKKFGAELDSGDDFLELTPLNQPLTSPPLIQTYNDHRMAMSFAPLSLLYPGIKIENPEVVIKSYPNYWTDLQSAGFRLNLHT